MSSSESSDSISEGSYGCPEYEIEDENVETSSIDEYESEPSYAIEDELLDNMDALAVVSNILFWLTLLTRPTSLVLT